MPSKTILLSLFLIIGCSSIDINFKKKEENVPNLKIVIVQATDRINGLNALLVMQKYENLNHICQEYGELYSISFKNHIPVEAYCLIQNTSSIEPNDKLKVIEMDAEKKMEWYVVVAILLGSILILF